jgi:hypothetical protein
MFSHVLKNVIMSLFYFFYSKPEMLYVFQENDVVNTKLKLRYGKSALYGAPTGAMDLMFPRRLQYFHCHR